MSSRWHRPYSGRGFPRTWSPEEFEPLRPRSLARALVKAAHKDARQGRRQAARDARGGEAVGLDTMAPPAPHSAALVARLPEEERRRIALRLQRERRGLDVRDEEWFAGRALAEARCGWRPQEVRELFALAFDGLDRRRPAPIRRLGVARALQLPLAALEELPEQERAGFAADVRTALVAVLGCDGPQSVVRVEPPGPAEEAAAARMRALLGLPPYEEMPALPVEPYGTAARCGLGTAQHEPEVRELLELCRQVSGVRPEYAWLGRAREMLEGSAAAREALVPLLAAARREPADCPHRELHHGMVTEAGTSILVAAAWAACVSDDEDAVRELGRTLFWVNENLWGLPVRRFLRGGLAALAALSGEPGVGRHHRMMVHAPREITALAGRILAEIGVPPAAGEYEVGEYTAVFDVSSAGRVTLAFRNRQGRLLKEIPDLVRSRNPMEYAALRARLGEIRAEVAAHVGSLAERMHADPGRPAARWRATHLDTPTLEPLTAALVWQADTPDGPVIGMPVRRKRSGEWVLRDLRGAYHQLADDTPVHLWNPHTADAAQVTAWTTALRRRPSPQPIPQLPL